MFHSCRCAKASESQWSSFSAQFTQWWTGLEMPGGVLVHTVCDDDGLACAQVTHTSSWAAGTDWHTVLATVQDWRETPGVQVCSRFKFFILILFIGWISLQHSFQEGRRELCSLYPLIRMSACFLYSQTSSRFGKICVSKTFLRILNALIHFLWHWAQWWRRQRPWWVI